MNDVDDQQVPAAAPEATDAPDGPEPSDGSGPSGPADRTESAPGEEPDGTIEMPQIIEAVLFASDAPVAPQRLVEILGTGDARSIRGIVAGLNETYEQQQMSFRIESLAGGYQMLTLPAFRPWLMRLGKVQERQRLSPASLETLAIVAYKQPVLRADVEAIRGVQCGEMLNRLREMGLVRIVGRAEDVGRPILYGTTRRFLEVFGLADLKDLPQVEELKAP